MLCSVELAGPVHVTVVNCQVKGTGWFKMVELGWFILCDLSSYSWLGQLCSVGRSDKGVEREQKYEKSLDTLIQSSYNLISGAFYSPQ